MSIKQLVEPLLWTLAVLSLSREWGTQEKTSIEIVLAPHKCDLGLRGREITLFTGDPKKGFTRCPLEVDLDVRRCSERRRAQKWGQGEMLPQMHKKVFPRPPGLTNQLELDVGSSKVAYEPGTMSCDSLLQSHVL